jgi:uncharacterized membrane protein
MLRQNKWKILITSLITLIPMAVGCFLWSGLPDTIATHFGSDNTANGWSSKGFTVFGIPAFLVMIHLFVVFVTAMDPKTKNIGKKPLGIIFWICPLVSLMMYFSIYAVALGFYVDVGFVCSLFLGILLIVLGNYLPKVRQNYSFGIKVPWTLNDVKNWNSTHRLAGKCMVIGGGIVVVTSFLHYWWIIFAALAVSVAIPICYSYIYYIRHRD